MKPDNPPAFPNPEMSRAHFNTADAYPGMSLRDYFASKETLAEWNSSDVVPSTKMCEKLAGEPMPEYGWGGDIIAMLKWEAKWRAALKYLRADAMLSARAKEATS